MPDPWEALKAELHGFDTDTTFRPFRPLVDSLQALVNTRQPNPETAQLLVTVIRALHDAPAQGAESRQLAEDVAAGVFQPNWAVAGNVLQAHRDVVINIVSQALPQLKLPEPGIPVSIVVVAMTAAEAAALDSGAAFAEYPDFLREEFTQLRAHLAADWVTAYGAERRLWRPFGSPETIEQRLAAALTAFNSAEGLAKPLVPKLYDVLDLSNDANRGSLRRLRTAGCVVIVDSVSFRHPALLRAFQRDLLDAFPRTSVLTLAPHANSLRLVGKMTYALQLRLEESEFHQRYRDPTEDYACEQLSALEGVPRWFLGRVRLLSDPALAKSGIRQFIR